MPFIIIKDNAGDLILNTDQITQVYKNLGKPTYAVIMSHGNSPVDLDAQQYEDLKTLLGAEAFPKNSAAKLSDRMDQIK